MKICEKLFLVLPLMACVVCAEPVATNSPASTPVTVPVVTPSTNAAQVTTAPKKKEKSEEDFDLGVECLRKGNFAVAAQAFRDVLTVRTNNAEALCNLAVAYVQLGYQSHAAQQQSEFWQQAADSFGKAATVKPNSKMVYLLWADALILIGDTTKDGKQRLTCYRDAAEKCRRATEIAPQDGEGYNKLAMLLATKMPEFAVNDRVRFTLYKEGAEFFGKAARQLTFSGEVAPAYANCGNALVQAAQFTNDPTQKESLLREARGKYEKSANTVGTGARIWSIWGKTCLDLGRLTQARADFREAVDRFNTSLSIEENDPATLYNLACAYMCLNRTVTALETLKKCFELDAGKTYVTSAQKDPDFAPLRGQDNFESLVATYLKRGTSGL